MSSLKISNPRPSYPLKHSHKKKKQELPKLFFHEKVFTKTGGKAEKSYYLSKDLAIEHTDDDNFILDELECLYDLYNYHNTHVENLVKLNLLLRKINIEVIKIHSSTNPPEKESFIELNNLLNQLNYLLKTDLSIESIATLKILVEEYNQYNIKQILDFFNDTQREYDNLKNTYQRLMKRKKTLTRNEHEFVSSFRTYLNLNKEHENNIIIYNLRIDPIDIRKLEYVSTFKHIANG
ncbi:MAG: hypothetical protein K1060chlam5_00623 [Candidatus Anoxychlamydiales bacterium]|nr:hypothetical protein [Candidatus Anoxychlamydiales bacterium]